MPDNEFAARVEGNQIVANVIRGYQRQLAEAQAELATLRAEYADYQRVAKQSTIESVLSVVRLRAALGSITRLPIADGPDGLPCDRCSEAHAIASAALEAT